MEKERSLRYTCINCGAKVDELYKMYSPTVLKLSTCNKCGEISDKYIEYDPVIIVIDLVLLQKEAYRHFLYNTEFKNHWKLAVLVQLMEAYSEWMFNMSKRNMKDNTASHEFFFNQHDLQFYLICLKIVFGAAIYNIILYLLTLFFEKCTRISSSRIDFNMILKTFTISSFGKFFLLPALIWTDRTGENLNILFVFVYTTLCQFLVYSVVCRLAMVWAIIVIVISNLMRIMSTDKFDSIFLYSIYNKN